MTELLKKGQTDEENPLAADHIKGVGFGLYVRRASKNADLPHLTSPSLSKARATT